MEIDLNPYSDLWLGPIHWFSDWPNGSPPRTGAVVYSIWDRDNRFLYVGMSGRSHSPDNEVAPRGQGPWGRLNSHRNGRRSGDQFCVYLSDRVVLPSLHNRISEIASGSLSLDTATREYVAENLGYRWIGVGQGRIARAIEVEIQKGMAECGRPFLNPIQLSGAVQPSDDMLRGHLRVSE